MRVRRRVEATCARCGGVYSVRSDQAVSQRYCSRECKYAPLADRFAAKVRRGSPDECWLWTGTRRAGYGLVSAGGRQQGAHRIAYELEHGCAIPDGLDVLHSCDNPSCVNPRHLSIGTHTDNMRDMAAKGRNRCRTKLTPDAIAAIRASEERPVDLAGRYGVHPSTITNVRARRVWSAANA